MTKVHVARSPLPIRFGNIVVDPPVLQAPMAGFTNFAFRQIVRGFGGVGLMATEMVSARSFAWMDAQRQESPDRLWGVRSEPRPLAVQIWDNDPQTLARVGSALAHDFRVSVVDLNFGCPVKQVTQHAHSGSYLLRYPDRMGQIIRRVVEACEPVPVTAKIRLGCSPQSINAIEVAQVVEESGAAALTVHGRTAQDYFRGTADWDRIAAIKPYLRHIPLIGNGDLDSVASVCAAFRDYPVDGVMIARACLGRPWLFCQIAAALRGAEIPPDPGLDEQRDCLLRHYDLVVQRFGEQKGTFLMRKYACTYAAGCSGARQFRFHAARVATREEFLGVVAQYFPRSESGVLVA
jgi:tRNA-dihydrouridine synthase B